jgi:hypothetical protein
MLLKSISSAALVSAAALIAGPASAAILVNGDFESPGGVVRQELDTTDYIPGWTHSDPSVSLDIYESDNFDGLTAADGTHYVSFGHSGTSGGSLWQVFATTPGVTYTVHYSVAEQQGDDPGQVLEAMITNGAQVLTADNAALPLTFQPGKTLTFIASGASATLTFTDATPLGGGGGSNLALDAVSVSSPGAGGVPEPATWALALLGFAGMGAALRSRRAFGVRA